MICTILKSFMFLSSSEVWFEQTNDFNLGRGQGWENGLIDSKYVPKHLDSIGNNRSMPKNDQI